MKKSVPFCLALFLFLTGCQQTTMIQTQPSGARVWVNQIRLEGTSPATFTTRNGLPTTARMKVDIEGYEPQRDLPLEKSYHADATLLWLIPGLIPYFFTARFEEEITVSLTKKKS